MDRRRCPTCPHNDQGRHARSKPLPRDLNRPREGRAAGVPASGIVSASRPGSRHVPHNARPGSPGQRDELRLLQLGGRPPLASSAWSPPSSLPLNDHADGATLGRQGRTRRPVMRGRQGGGRSRDRGSVRISDRISGSGRVRDSGSGRDSVRSTAMDADGSEQYFTPPTRCSSIPTAIPIAIANAHRERERERERVNELE